MGEWNRGICVLRCVPCNPTGCRKRRVYSWQQSIRRPSLALLRWHNAVIFQLAASVAMQVCRAGLDTAFGQGRSGLDVGPEIIAVRV